MNKTILYSKVMTLFLFSIGNLTNAQITTFEKTFGGNNAEYGHALSLTADGGFIITGQTFSNGDTLGDSYLIKTDSEGNLLWSKTVGGNNVDGGNSIFQTSDGGYFVTNHTESYGAGDCDSWVFKTDSAGNLLWSKTFGGIIDDIGQEGIETSDGNFIVTGITGAHKDSIGGDAFLVKYSQAGNILWNKTYGGAGSEDGRRIIESPDGGFVIAGMTTTNSNGQQDILVYKINANGDLLWLKNFGGAGIEEGYGLSLTSDGGYVICGFSTSFGTGDEDAFLIKVNDSGNQLWSKNYGGTSNEIALSVASTPDGGFVMTGFTKSFGDSLDMLLIKTDEYGNQIWMKTFPDKNYLKECNWIVACPDGGYAMVGSKGKIGEYPDLYFLKTDSEGNTYTNIIDPGKTSSAFFVYPNPSLNSINLSYDNSISNPIIQIYNFLGKLVIDEKNEKSINISGLPSGFYYITLKDGNKIFSKKFVRE